MVIPWVGFSLAELIKRVEPTGNAKFVQFVTLADQDPDAWSRSSVLEWPYVEGLRMDEAMHPLTLLALGLYGEVLPNQNGAPVRLVVPWKYGFKSAKSIVQDPLRGQAAGPAGNGAASEYGFYSNVNPQRGPPALEPGDRAPHRRGRPVHQEAADADVQRLRSRRWQLYAGMDLKSKSGRRRPSRGDRSSHFVERLRLRRPLLGAHDCTAFAPRSQAAALLGIAAALRAGCFTARWATPWGPTRPKP